MWLHFRYDLGQGPARIRSKEKLSLHKWHNIVASRIGFRGELKIDSLASIKGQPTRAGLSQLNVNRNLYFGSVPSISKG